MNRQLGTKWFTFYTKVRPCLACFAVISVISDFIQYTDIYLSTWWLLLYFLAAIAQPILCVAVAIKSSGNYIDFVSFVKGVLLFETVNMAYQQGVLQYINSGFAISVALIISIIILLIGYFVWYRLNVKYFEKRILKPGANDFSYAAEHLPYISPNEKEQDMPETNKIHFCRKCGEKLIVGSRFCRKCGTEIVELPVAAAIASDNCVFCKKCGADITKDTETCHVCGEQKGMD